MQLKKQTSKGTMLKIQKDKQPSHLIPNFLSLLINYTELFYFYNDNFEVNNIENIFTGKCDEHLEYESVFHPLIHNDETAENYYTPFIFIDEKNFNTTLIELIHFKEKVVTLKNYRIKITKIK